MIPSLLLTFTLVAQDTVRLTLSSALERALASYPTLAAARAQEDRAAADLREARAAWFPRISLDASLTRFQEPMVVQPLHGFDPTQPPLFDRTLVQSGAALTYTLLDFGTRSGRVRAQQALAGAAGAGLREAEDDVTARVVSAYLRTRSSREVLLAQDQRLQALSSHAARAAQLLAEGKAARVELLRAQAELQRARADRIAGAARLDLAERELAQLTALPVATVRTAVLPALILADPGVATDTAPATRDGLVARARDGSPQLRRQRAVLQAAAATASAVRATRLPELRVASAYIDRGRWWGDFAAEWQVGLSVSYPLFTGGARSGAIRRAEAEARAAAARVAAGELAAEQAVDQGLAALREAHARVAALATAVEQSAEVARIERLALDVGSGTQSDYLSAEAALLQARAGLIEARHAEISARIALARAAGDLSPEWLAANLESQP